MKLLIPLAGSRIYRVNQLKRNAQTVFYPPLLLPALHTIYFQSCSIFLPLNASLFSLSVSIWEQLVLACVEFNVSISHRRQSQCQYL